MTENKKIILYLMTEKGYQALKSILSFKNYILFVVIGKDKNLKSDFSSKIKHLCSKNELIFYERNNIPKIKDTIYIFAISWRWMIDHPENRLIIFHDSLLPKYRGYAPLVNMLINGERKIGVTAIFGKKEYDTGNIIDQKSSVIKYPIKIQDAININNINFEIIIQKIIKKIILNKRIEAVPQNSAIATYSIWRDRADYYINWKKSAIEIKRFIDAVGFPYNGALTRVNNKDVIIEDAEIFGDIKLELRHIGKVVFLIEGFPIVICGRGLIKITKGSYLNSTKNLLPIKKFRTKFLNLS